MNRSENLFTVSSEFRSDYRVKGSKFFGFLNFCETAEVAEKILNNLWDEHHGATHHCYAYRINPVNTTEFAQDDSEPSGTAGAPILNVLKSECLINSILVVVRYYGGTKLGKSGLIDAYREAAELCAAKAVKKPVIPVQIFAVTFGYDKQGLINTLKHQFNWIEMEADYSERVILKLACPVDELDTFRNKINSVKHELDEVKELNETYIVSES